MPASFHVDPDKVQQLAVNQDEAAAESATAATLIEKEKVPLTTGVWLTHGIYSAPSNSAFNELVGARRAAALMMKEACLDQGAKARAAAVTYAGVDQDLAENLKNQMLDR